MKKLTRLAFSLILFIIPFILKAQDKGIDERINEAFDPIENRVSAFVFYSIEFGEGLSMPIVIIILLAAATFFTIYFNFVNIRNFMTSINVVRGKYDEIDSHEAIETADVNIVEGDIVDTIKVEGHEGEVSHFQALTAALSGTVGLGNIAGVAIAISLGGPGATFWMILAGLLGMSSKFVECTLGVRFRDISPDGTVYGGPMYYLSKGLKERG